MYTNEATQSAAAAAAASSKQKTETADGALFSKELMARIKDSKPSKDKIIQTMEKLANAYPGATVTSKPIAGFGDVGSYLVSTGGTAAANITPDIMSAMADDEELFKKVKGMIDSLMAAGKEEELAPGNEGGSTNRMVNISAEEARYVEAQVDADGKTTSISSLVFEVNKSMNETLDMLFGQKKGNQGGGQASGGQGFSGIMEFSASWRMESMFSTGSSAMQALQSQQGMIGRLDIMIQQMNGGMTAVDMMMMNTGTLNDPIVLDLGDEGFNMTSAEDGVYFDIRGDGSKVKTGWISGNNAFLYKDANGNGTADDVNELFGNQDGYANGYDKLAQYDDNGDGVLDAQDAAYNELRLWRDLNGDGVNQKNESMTLAEAGVKSLNLNYKKNWQYDQHGNAIGETSSFTRTDGSKGQMADLWLKQG